MIPLPEILYPASADFANAVARVPNALGVYLLTPESGNPYLGWSGYLSKRLSRLLLGPRDTDSNLFAKLRAGLTQVEYWLTASRLETSLLLYWLARRHDPTQYRRRLKLRTPWLVELLTQDPFPRLFVQNRNVSPNALSYGPFPTRDAAERFELGINGLFQIRRCTDRLLPREDHPGCIYGEMNQCMRPCQLAVTPKEYATEVSRVADFLVSNGRHMTGVLTAARERACEAMEFEQAARIHRDMERVKGVVGLRDEIITEVHELNGVALTLGLSPRSVALWPMLAGYWQPPLTIDFANPDSSAKSLDRQLREQLGQHLAAPNLEGDRLEQMALLSRWYYSTWRDGTWFAFRDLADLDYRALVRRISAMVRERMAGEASLAPGI
jgi:hypothetical protein